VYELYHPDYQRNKAMYRVFRYFCYLLLGVYVRIISLARKIIAFYRFCQY